MSEYLDFLRTVTPAVLGLTSLTTRLLPKRYWSLRRDPRSAQRVLSAEYRTVNVQDDYFDVEASYELTIRAAEKDEPVLLIACVFEGHFHAAAPIKAEYAEQFAEKDSWLIFWPYFRQLVFDITGRMSIPPELLPLHLRPGKFTRSLKSKPTEKQGTKKSIAAPRKRPSRRGE